jgi:hypothetical protein
MYIEVMFFGKLKNVEFQGDVWMDFSWEEIRNFDRSKRSGCIYSTVENKNTGDIENVI